MFENLQLGGNKRQIRTCLFKTNMSSVLLRMYFSFLLPHSATFRTSLPTFYESKKGPLLFCEFDF